MIGRRSVLAALVSCLLAGLPAEGATGSAKPPPADLPGVSVEGLSQAQKALLADWAKDAFCYCGSPHTVSQVLREHGTCRHASRMATLAARVIRGGVSKKEELVRMLDAYYASFDKRVRLDVSRFGPPLGNPEAPVTIVEFSDFTCPYCRKVRPALETFVRVRSDRVKLYYKPFPIESHPGALECAQAGEWAREKGRFWAMHDALFESGSHSVDELAGLARGLGMDPEDLRQAIEEKRHVEKIRASQAEARAAGLEGTPTLFLDGRKLALTDYSDEGLELTLQDEEEWITHRGWIRD